MIAFASPLHALDRARSMTLRVLGPRARPLLIHRELRVAVYGVVSAAVAFALAVWVPLPLLLIGPLLFGVPHLVADVRYLVVKPALHRRAEIWVLCAIPSAAAWVWPHAGLAFAVVLGAALVARAASRARAIVALLAVIGLGCAAHAPSVAGAVLAHAHNLVAVGLFVFWSRRRTRAHWAPIAAFLLGAGLLLGGAIDADLAPAAAHSFARVLAPHTTPAVARRLVVFFAFAQSMHYAIWLRLIPEQDRERPGLRSFESSLRALLEDVGRPFVLLAALLIVGLVLLAFGSLEVARLAYFRLAMFHGPLELGAAVVLALEGKLPKGVSS